MDLDFDRTRKNIFGRFSRASVLLFEIVGLGPGTEAFLRIPEGEHNVRVFGLTGTQQTKGDETVEGVNLSHSLLEGLFKGGARFGFDWYSIGYSDHAEGLLAGGRPSFQD